jgi:hypothetical protein
LELDLAFVYVMVFFFYYQWFEMRDDSYICWYWWNCWTLLFKRYFQNDLLEVFNLTGKIIHFVATCILKS